MDENIISLINHIIFDEHKNKSLEADIPNKKKKVNLKDITKESMDNVNDYDFEKSMIIEKPCKINKASGNNESFETRTLKEKTKRNKKVSSEDYNNPEERTHRDCKENEALECTLNIKNESFETRTPKKKKHNTNPSSKDFTTTEKKLPEITTENINDNDFEKSMIIKRKCKSKIVSENNENFEIETPKKKKKHNKKVSSEEFINTEEKLHRDCRDNEKLECTLSINNESFETRTPKKKKHNTNPSSKDFTTAEKKLPEITTENINDNDFEKSMIIKRKCKSKIVSENNENFETETPKKKKKYNKKVSSEEFINTEEKPHRDYRDNEESENSFSVNNKSFETRTSKKKDHNTYPSSNDFITCEKNPHEIITDNFIENDDVNVFKQKLIVLKKDKNIDKTFDGNNDNMTMILMNESNYDDMSITNESTIFNDEKEDDDDDDDDNGDLLEALESVIHLCESETETEINLNKFNLSNYLVTKTSLNDHPNYENILKYWNQQQKLIINNKYEMGTKSDIILLKFIGNKYIEIIKELLEDFTSIQDLKIQVPVKSKENKLHYVETALRHPNKETMKIIKQLNPSVKLGVFNEDEDTIIRKYWSKFQQEYKISVVRPFLLNILQLTLPHKEKFNFVRYISVELPNRLLFSVFNRFNVLVNYQRDKFSFKHIEDQFIMKIENCDAFKNKFSILSLILNRTRLQLYRRINTLKMRPSRCERILWDIDRQQELFTNILLETKTENWEDLQNMTINKKTWIKIAKCCSKKINYEKVKSQWKFLSTMLFCKTLIKCSTFKITVLEFLLELKPKYWTDINWIDVTNKLYPGANSKIINTMFRRWVHSTVPSKIRKNVKDTLLYLEKYQKDLVIEKIKLGIDKEFKRLTVKNYNLLVEIE